MTKKYIDNKDLQIAMTQYQDGLGTDDTAEVKDQYNRSVGYVSQVYDNQQGAGEQVYVVVADFRKKL